MDGLEKRAAHSRAMVKRFESPDAKIGRAREGSVYRGKFLRFDRSPMLWHGLRDQYWLFSPINRTELHKSYEFGP